MTAILFVDAVMFKTRRVKC